jgi:PTS system nitrogen regulatory IIA component
MTIGQILHEGNVRIDQVVRDADQLVAMLSAECARVTNIPAPVIAEALHARERLGSTGLGSGIAIPHARLRGLSAPFAFAIRLKKPVKFDSVDDMPVDFAVALLLPEGKDPENLIHLAGITRRLRDKDVMKAIRAAHDPGTVYRLFVGENCD